MTSHIAPAPPDRPQRPALQAQTTVQTPLGPLLLVATAQGLAGAWFDAQRHHPGAFSLPEDPQHRWLQAASQAFDAYFRAADGHTAAQGFDLPLDTAGTPFQQAVWQALCAIPAGQLSSYGAIAVALGRPAAVRAVGAAVGRNPVSIAIPCHRVVGQQGQLTGYAGGLWRKQALLQHEGLALVDANPLPGTAQAPASTRVRWPEPAATAQAELFAAGHADTAVAAHRTRGGRA